MFVLEGVGDGRRQGDKAPVPMRAGLSVTWAHEPCTGRGLPMAVMAQGAPKVRGKGTDAMLRDTV